MKKFSRFLKIFKKIIFYSSFLALILAAIIAFSSRFNIPGGYRLYTVLSGSMQPTLPTGSLIITKIPKDSQEIQKDKIITFEQPGFENKFVTHRVYRVVQKGNARFFATKGDANNSPDSWLISYGRVKGIYQKDIPYLGYFLEFMRSPFGIVLFVIIPVSIVVIEELKNIGGILLAMKLEKEKLKEKRKVGRLEKKCLGQSRRGGDK